nr:class I tRNA ligase family protein [Actinomycetota bacterium]
TITRDGTKMSKSRGNVVNPDDYVDRHGGDVLRAHLLSSGRWSATADFSEAGITGVERLFTRLWRLAHGAPDVGPGVGPEALARGAAQVARGIENLRFNNAIGALRELAARASRAETPTLVLLLAPFAPYLSEELWESLGGTYSVHAQQWPAMRCRDSEPSTVQLVVQVDGRVRDRLPVARGMSAAEATALAESTPNMVRHLAGRTVVRRVHVPDRLVNFVTARRVSEV